MNRPSLWKSGMIMVGCLWLPACQTFEPVDAMGARAAVGVLPDAAPSCRRIRRSVDLESPFINGHFEAVLISRSGTAPAGRLQLLPQVGPKLLDLAFHATGVAGYFPAAGETLSWDSLDGEDLPRHPLSFIAVSLIEDATPLTYERIQGVRVINPTGPSGASIELLLGSAIPGCAVSVLLDDDRNVVGRRYKLRGVRWAEQRDGDITRFEGRNFAWEMGPAVSEEIPPPRASLFELQVPGTGSRSHQEDASSGVPRR